MTTLPCETLRHNIAAEQADGKCSNKTNINIYNLCPEWSTRQMKSTTFDLSPLQDIASKDTSGVSWETSLFRLRIVRASLGNIFSNFLFASFERFNKVLCSLKANHDDVSVTSGKVSTASGEARLVPLAAACRTLFRSEHNFLRYLENYFRRFFLNRIYVQRQNWVETLPEKLAEGWLIWPMAWTMPRHA